MPSEQEAAKAQQQDVAAFFDHHCSAAGGVIVVHIHDGEGCQMGVFSSFNTAQEWIDRFDDAHQAVVVPYVLDEPDYGNVPPSAQN
ncbi:MAG: hypothetical protein K5872_22220 [Rhizobiaceae bacterium]|nr:hypothetical protein [Rhizobiaceae bacterium]MCV0408937.1 hypothetical protein [Rhizobiaceae bacterium]